MQTATTRAGVDILISENRLRIKNVSRDKEPHFISVLLVVRLERKQ